MNMDFKRTKNQKKIRVKLIKSTTLLLKKN